jgi:hypothetical protein
MANIHTPIPNLKLNDGTSIPMVSLLERRLPLQPDTNIVPPPTNTAHS